MVFLLFARFKIVENNFDLLKGFTNNCYSVLPMNLESRQVFFVSFLPSASWAWIMSPGDVHIIIFVGIRGWGNCGKTSFSSSPNVQHRWAGQPFFLILLFRKLRQLIESLGESTEL